MIDSVTNGMTIKYVIIGTIVTTLLISSVSNNVSATGVRHDAGDDATLEESHCWRDGYDSGFGSVLVFGTR